MIIDQGSKFVIIGDSITDCGRAYPIGETPRGLGNGYVSLIDAFFQTTYPDRHIRVINVGTSGNTVRDVALRWDQDVMALNPDWLSVMIGINDVCRQFDEPLIPESHVFIEEYQETLEELISNTKCSVKGIVLLSPFYIDLNTEDPIRKMVEAYSIAMHQIAVRNECLFIDTQAAFDNILKYYHPCYISADRIHPNLIGHMVLARTLLKAFNYNWSPTP